MPSLKKSDKPSPLALIADAIRPGRGLAGLWYRFYGWTEPPPRTLPPPVLETSKDEMFKRISFTFALIALSARVACSGSALSKEKYAAFRDAFPLTGGICGKIRMLFTLACENQTPYDQYIGQIKAAFPNQMPLFISLVDRLFRIACADDKPIARETEHMLARMAHLFGISPPEYSKIYDRYTSPKAHKVLGVEKRTPKNRLKKRYHELMRIYHPDRFASGDISPEVSLVLRLKASEINAAYNALSRRKAA